MGAAHQAIKKSALLAQVGNLMIDDPGIHEQAMAPWDLTMTPLSGGTYQLALTFLAGPRLILYREHYWNRTRAQGLSPQGMLAICVPLMLFGNSCWWKAPLHEKGIPTTMPGGLDVEVSAGQQHLVSLIDLGLLRENAPADVLEATEFAGQNHVLPASQDAVTRLGETLSHLLDVAQVNAKMLSHPPAVSCLEQDLLAALRASLALPIPVQRRAGAILRQRGLRRAVEYLRSSDTASITVADLCRAACVSERTLEHAFRETFGASPLQFLQLRRYHHTRRDLLAADPEAATVTTIAMNNGFYELGRFAVRYKQLFGELPSQTLMNPPIEPLQGLGLAADLDLMSANLSRQVEVVSNVIQ